MQSTKKLPVGVNAKTRKPARGGHLVPGSSNNFLCLKTGKTYAEGVICYLGVAVQSTEILARAATLDEQLRGHLSQELLDDYIGKLQQFKIGDVIRIQLGDNKSIVIEKSSERLSIGKIPNLP